MAVAGHPYAGRRIGLATRHGKERALAPAFGRVPGAEIVVPALDTDTPGTFSGEVPRPNALASEGSYGPIERVPLAPGGELLAFVDRKRGIRHVETLTTHRTSWRLQRFAADDPARVAALKEMGFPAFGVRGAALGRRARGALLRHARALQSAAHESAARGLAPVLPPLLLFVVLRACELMIPRGLPLGVRHSSGAPPAV